MEARKKFRIERLEERIAPSALCVVRGGSKAKGGSHKGGSHKGGSHKGGSHNAPPLCDTPPPPPPCHTPPPPRPCGY